jgi:hypothetical protein
LKVGFSGDGIEFKPAHVYLQSCPSIFDGRSCGHPVAAAHAGQHHHIHGLSVDACWHIIPSSMPRGFAWFVITTVTVTERRLLEAT